MHKTEDGGKQNKVHNGHNHTQDTRRRQAK